MASNVFKLKILTPQGAVLDASVQSATVPLADGEIGVLPGHARHMGLLGNGTLSYITADGAATKGAVQISGGFCTFSGDVLTVLADSSN
jgi:F-type H+-transporting ATPase subunit epsilon